MFDGEGYDFPDGTHRMVLLASSDGDYVENEDGLSTVECIEFLTRKRPKAYNVWFSFGYDVNKILTDLPLHGERSSIEHLWDTGRTWRGNVFVKYIPRKFFTVRYGKSRSFHSADAFSFFQTSFLKACEKWGIDTTAIVEGKAARGLFNTWTLAEIREYNFAELALALELMNRLRDAFATVNLVPQSWHGPGAIAMRWLQREGLDAHYAPVPDAMTIPVRHAYFGGRIDMALVGQADAYLYDLASAYPKGLTDCISLRTIEWEHSTTPIEDDRHALYHVKWRTPNPFSPWHPLPWRTKTGSVLFPPEGEGWYWGVETLAAERAYPGSVHRLEAFYPRGLREYPFANAIERDYLLRFSVGKDTGAGKAIRLALNSLYGKLCQHTTSGQNKTPRWQNYVWAGYTTAHTRARMIDAVAEVGAENALAIATDGLFTRVPLHEEVQELGCWEPKGFGTTLFVAPGVYAIIKNDGGTCTCGAKEKCPIHLTVKRRGMPGNLNYGFILRSWGCRTALSNPGVDALSAKHTSFVGMGKALAQHAPWGVFLEDKRDMHDVTIRGTSKRVPSPQAMSLGPQWLEYPLLLRPRNEKCMSYMYEWREYYDPKEDKE